MTRERAAVQLYTVRDRLDIDIESVIADLASAGFSEVEPYDLARLAPVLAELLSKYGMSAPSAHASLVDAPAATLAAAHALGVKTIYEPFQPEERFIDQRALALLAADLNTAATSAVDEGLGFGYHNHWWELERHVNGRPALLELARLTDDSVTFEVDVFWAAVGGVDPVDLVRELGPRVTALHLKDGPISRDTSTQLPLGQGALDVAAILAAAPQARRVLEFDEYGGDIIDGLAQGHSFLRSFAR